MSSLKSVLNLRSIKILDMFNKIIEADRDRSCPKRIRDTLYNPIRGVRAEPLHLWSFYNTQIDTMVKAGSTLKFIKSVKDASLKRSQPVFDLDEMDGARLYLKIGRHLNKLIMLTLITGLFVRRTILGDSGVERYTVTINHAPRVGSFDISRGYSSGWIFEDDLDIFVENSRKYFNTVTDVLFNAIFTGHQFCKAMFPCFQAWIRDQDLDQLVQEIFEVISQGSSLDKIRFDLVEFIGSKFDPRSPVWQYLRNRYYYSSSVANDVDSLTKPACKLAPRAADFDSDAKQIRMTFTFDRSEDGKCCHLGEFNRPRGKGTRQRFGNEKWRFTLQDLRGEASDLVPYPPTKSTIESEEFAPLIVKAFEASSQRAEGEFLSNVFSPTIGRGTLAYITCSLEGFNLLWKPGMRLPTLFNGAEIRSIGVFRDVPLRETSTIADTVD